MKTIRWRLTKRFIFLNDYIFFINKKKSAIGTSLIGGTWEGWGYLYPSKRCSGFPGGGVHQF